MCLTIFKKLLDYEFNEEEDKFVFEEQVKTVYSPVFVRLIPHLNDIAVEESFYASDEDDMSDFQDDLLALLFYMFKTLSIRKLIRLGLKPRHLQFIIIHFTNSLFIPRVSSSTLSALSMSQPVSQPSKQPSFAFHSSFSSSTRSLPIWTPKPFWTMSSTRAR